MSVSKNAHLTSFIVFFIITVGIVLYAFMMKTQLTKVEGERNARDHDIVALQKDLGIVTAERDTLKNEVAVVRLEVEAAKQDSELCVKDACLMKDETTGRVIGKTTVSGYYRDFQRVVPGETAASTQCPVLVVQGTPNMLIEDYRTRASGGDMRMVVDQDDALLLNIPLASLSEVQKSVVIASDEGHPVMLSIQTTMAAKEGDICGTEVAVVEIR